MATIIDRPKASGGDFNIQREPAKRARRPFRETHPFATRTAVVLALASAAWAISEFIQYGQLIPNLLSK